MWLEPGGFLPGVPRNEKPGRFAVRVFLCLLGEGLWMCLPRMGRPRFCGRGSVGPVPGALMGAGAVGARPVATAA